MTKPNDEPLVPWKEIAAQSIDRTEAFEAERDELRVENKRLGIDMRAWKQRAETGEAEIERLRAELHRVAESRRGQRERADELSAECDQWQKKVAELWAERERTNAEWREQIQVEHAENRRLRTLVETAAAMVAKNDPDLADALLRRLVQ